jgi:hypothetical protein
MTHEDQVALEILSESAVESASRGAGRRAVASPHRRDACSAPPLPETVMTVSHGPQSLHAQAADKRGRQEEAGRRRGFKRQTNVAGKKKLVAGVDFAPPEPIASVLPRIQLTSSQADDLWALVCKGRRRNPNNDADAEMAKAIFAGAALANAVQQALQFYVRDVIFLSIFYTLRERAAPKNFPAVL